MIGPAGQILRRYVDTNGDNIVDQWHYYNRGLEVYRDMDSNFNRKVDQSRWLNTAGSRWGLDNNEDGRIDTWKLLSAEEATRLAVQALVAADARALQGLLIGPDEVRELGIDAALSKKLLPARADIEATLRSTLQSSRIITPQTQWMRFDSSMPGVIPAEDGKATSDLHVYENVMAIVETAGQPGLVQIGEMVRVGDVWKLTQVPQPLEGNSVQVTEGGILMQPTVASSRTFPGVGSVSPEMQELLKQLQDLDQNSPAQDADRTVLARYNSQRADLLSKLSELSKTPEERQQWQRQMIDGLATAVQTGAYPAGLQRLKRLESEARRDSPRSLVVAYASYRRMLAEYGLDVQAATDNKKRQQVQDQWLKNLEAFVEQFPKADDAPEAILQLAISQEFTGKFDDAEKWYRTLVTKYGDASAGARAAGALRRLDLKGKQFAFSGIGLNGGTVDVSQYKGRVLLLSFWATWCVPCTQDLPQLRSLYEQYRDRGFEIIGVNLDATVDPVRPYLAEHRVVWPQIFEPGGLASKPATTFGVISLPTMFLVDADGKVVNRNAAVADVKALLANRMK